MMDDLYLYRQNFRKSKNFLLPLAGVPAFPKGLIQSVKDVPLSTYIADDLSGIDVDDHKLICVYQPSEEEAFKIHEHKYLLQNKRFCDYKEVSGLMCYMLDLSDYKRDFEAVTNGRYSTISSKNKEVIDKWHYKRLGNERFTQFVEFMYPNEKVYEKYAKALGVDIELLIEGVELCSPPNMEEETFSQKNLEKLLESCNFAQTTQKYG